MIFAPIRLSGVIIRFIGRDWIDSSPLRCEVKFCPAKIPLINLVVVPELPTSSREAGSFRPCIPFPWIVTLSPFCSISIPIFLKQLIVERQSAPSRNPVSSVIPEEIEPNITPLCEIDLSPGTVISPLSDVAFVKIIFYILFIKNYIWLFI